ncbi:MAG: glycoside hydrolase family 2, partial [Bacilli bacterium]|nr:glycoside hydrolase family 2 [Bacilli bacterium]
RSIYAKGFNYHGEPIVLSEFGGIAFRHDANGWGYTAVKSETEFLSTYGRLLGDIKASACLAGFCYTQLTDVFQETNGLLTFDRKPKADVEKIRSFNDLIKTTAT